MSAGAEWNQASHDERVRLYGACGALMHHGASFRDAEIGRPWGRLDAETQRLLHRAWTEEREAEAGQGDAVAAEKRFSVDEIIEAIQRDSSIGLCVACGNEQGGCEPDARRRTCEACGAPAVYGAEELLVMTQS